MKTMMKMMKSIGRAVLVTAASPVAVVAVVTSTSLPAGGVTVASADSAAFRLDTRTGVLESSGDEELTWSGRWYGVSNPSVALYQVGEKLEEGLTGEGTYAWSVKTNGTYTLIHVTDVYGNGTAFQHTSARFKVTGKADPPSISNVVAAAQMPKAGKIEKVDLTFTLAGDATVVCPDGWAPYLKVTATDNVTGSNYVAEVSALSGDTGATAGAHHIVWDFAAQGIDLTSRDVTFTVAYDKRPSAAYCVVDLSAGPTASAQSYPVSYLDDVPPGGWTDAEKTDKLVLRLIDPARDGNGGTFMMGAKGDGTGGVATTLTNAYYIGVFEVTQRQWELVMGDRPSFFTNELYYATRPVENVSYDMIRGASTGTNWPQSAWVDDNSFLGKLRPRCSLIFDLPTEARWEYACRAGTTTDFNNNMNLTHEYGQPDPAMELVGRYHENSGFRAGTYSEDCTPSNGTATVGSYLPNAWGLYDMHGNVMEWCLDWRDGGWTLPGGTEPVGVDSGDRRVLRGGSWDYAAGASISSWLGAMAPDNNTQADRGFRVCLPVSEAELCAGVSAPVDLREPADIPSFVARAHDPWDGKVDLEFTLTGDVMAGLSDWNVPYLFVTATDNETGSNYVAAASALSGDTSGTAGVHRLVWDFDKQGIWISSSRVSFSVSYLRMPDWCVIDLSGGTSAASYPVTYLDYPPFGGWTDADKTDMLVMRLINPGTFMMGERRDVGGGVATTLTTAYYMGVFEVTQRQWELVMGDRPSYFTNELYYATRPVENVSYDMIRGATEGTNWPQSAAVDDDSFMGLLRAKTGIAGFDLPTEARWEYACRAGTTSDLNSGKDLASTYSQQDAAMDEVGRYWFNGGDGYSPDCTTSNGTAAVGSYLPNAWGLYDMHGNVREWCLDWYGASLSGGVEPVGADTGTYRVRRNGAWSGYAWYCASSYRERFAPRVGNEYLGFRLARSLTTPEEERRHETDDWHGRPGTVCIGEGAPIAIRPIRKFTANDVVLTGCTNEYDGVGHGIGIATNAIAGLTLRYGRDVLVTSAPPGSAAVTSTALPLFTNVCEAVVWVEASAPGYFTQTNSATVKITPRDIAKATIAPIPDVVLTGAAAEPTPDVTDGDPSIITADDYTVSYLSNSVPGEARVVLAGKNNYTGTNSAPFKVVVAELKAEIGWAFLKASGTYFAQLKVTCTNGLAAGVSDLRFVFADRIGSDGTLEAALWHTPNRAANPNMETRGGETYRVVALDASRITSEGVAATYGVSDLSAATVPVAERTIELYVHRRVVPETGNEGAAKVGDFVGYVCWTSGGVSYALPVTATGVVIRKVFSMLRISNSDPVQPVPAARRGLWQTDAAFGLDGAATYDGYLVDPAADGAVAGTIGVKASKPSRTTGASALTVTVALTGRKKVTLRGTTRDGVFRATADGMALDIALGRTSLSGTFGRYAIDGARDLFAAKDAELKQLAAQALARWRGTYVVAWQDDGVGGWNGLSIAVKAKGRVKVTGTLADGTRVTAGAQLLVGEDTCAVAVSWAKKSASAACLLRFLADGTVTCGNIPGGASALAGRVGVGYAAGAGLHVDLDDLAAAVPGFRADLEVQPDLRLRQKVADGTFSGTFKVAADSGGRAKTVTLRVAGVVVDGKGYGSASVKGGGTCPVIVE